mgnify:CR=1 FL=1
MRSPTPTRNKEINCPFVLVCPWFYCPPLFLRPLLRCFLCSSARYPFVFSRCTTCYLNELKHVLLLSFLPVLLLHYVRYLLAASLLASELALLSGGACIMRGVTSYLFTPVVCVMLFVRTVAVSCKCSKTFLISYLFFQRAILLPLIMLARRFSPLLAGGAIH